MYDCVVVVMSVVGVCKCTHIEREGVGGGERDGGRVWGGMEGEREGVGMV